VCYQQPHGGRESGGPQPKDFFERHAKLQSIIEPFQWHTAAHTKLRRRPQLLARGIAHRTRTEQASIRLRPSRVTLVFVESRSVRLQIIRRNAAHA
jgi:hypothetical protein